MTIFQTCFVAPLANVYTDAVSDTQQSDQIIQSFDEAVTYKVAGSNSGSFALAATEFRSIPVLGTSLASQSFIMVRVSGQVELQTTGKDFDGTTTISGLTRTYGTALFPGFIILSTYNLTVINIVAVTDAVVQIFDSTLI